MKILFTCIGRRVELVQMFLKAAEKEKVNLEIHGADISETAPALYFCHKKHIVPRVSDSQYLPVLLRICRDEGIDLVIPTIDTDLILLSEHKQDFRSLGAEVLISESGVIKRCRNKMLTNQLFREVGLCAPESYDDIDNYPMDFPAFIKPIDGSSSVDAFRVDNQDRLQMLAQELKNYIIQPFISGEEYTIDIFCDFLGNPIFITPRKRLAMRSGEVIKTQVVQDDIIVKEAERLISFLKPCGALTVQLLRDKRTNEDYYIEINPRFGGGAPLTMDAGANSAAAILRLLSGKPVEYKKYAAEDGALYLRFDHSIKISKRKEDFDESNI